MVTTRAEQAERTRLTLLASAREQFAEKGYLATGITDITRGAGKSAGSFYNHFDDKESLLLALAEVVGEDADALIASSTGDMSRLGPHLTVFWHLQERHRVVLDAMRDAARAVPAFADRVISYWDDQMAPWIAIVDGLSQRGATLPGPPDFTARLVGDIARSFYARWTGDSETGLRELTSFLERSLSK